ncbi:hypothetical protein PIB30_068380 [Stylosanthes scabra]|uniref:Aminotransferase-like plant mobile domain-containing protein n=1 Tax=Stylosanthes scabra TaxID=79078 RepID=A0ABU6RNE3_9FABA|nr:hypothetical protein [Stylosanthes scabra]
MEHCLTLMLSRFRWTPYDSNEMQALIPDWMRSQTEVYTWRSAVPVVCFNCVRMHHIDRVIRQYGGEQLVPQLPVDVTRYMSSTGRGDDVWWPDRLSTWYDGWRRRRSPEVLVTVHFGGDPRGTQQYYEWYARVSRRGRFLSLTANLAHPRWTLALPGIPPEAVHPRDDLVMPQDAPAPRRRQVREPRPKHAGPAEEQREYDRQNEPVDDVHDEDQVHDDHEDLAFDKQDSRMSPLA